MTAANAFRALSLTFAAVAILGIEDVSINDAGEAVNLATDASPTVTAVFVDNIATEVTVRTTDLAAIASLHPGISGNLVAVFQKRAEGSGAAGSGNKTATLATATIISIAPKMGTNGVGEVEITFRCSGPAGTTPLVWS